MKSSFLSTMAAAVVFTLATLAALPQISFAADAKTSKPAVAKVDPETAKPSAIVTEPAGTISEGSAAGKNTPSTAITDPKYVIGAGDLLDISVWKDEALTKTVVVLPDGMIAFPLVGEIKAAGKTVSELKQEMEKLLSRYVSDLVLNMEVRQSNSMLIYVIGRVNSPGRQVLNARITVLQALAMAGGPNPFASKSKIRVFRQEGAETKSYRFRYDDVVEGKHMEDNIVLQRGDVVVVP